MTFPVQGSLQSLQCLHNGSMNKVVMMAGMETMHGLNSMGSPFSEMIQLLLVLSV